MRKLPIHLCLAALLSVAAATAPAQQATPAPVMIPAAPPSASAAAAAAASTPAEAPAPIEPPPAAAPVVPAPDSAALSAADQPPQSGTSPVIPAAPPLGGPVALGAASGSSRALNEFQGDDVAQVLRLLARQAKISLFVSDRIASATPPMKVTMRLENSSPMEAISVIIRAKGLIMEQADGVYYVKTKEEKDAEPTESASYTFSYATAEKVAPLLTAELESKIAPQFDARTNTIFYREVQSNVDKIKLFLDTIDKPTQQVMIEARLVEVTANPQQSYGLNWAGIVGGPSSPQTFSYGGSNIAASTTASTGVGSNIPTVGGNSTTASNSSTLTQSANIFGNAGNLLLSGAGKNLLSTLAGQFAILSVPEMNLTLRFLNQDADAEFLANPRVVTANNQMATIKITRNQPVPQLQFNQQTAQAVFGGFEDKDYGNTLKVTPCINKDDFVSLSVKPQISNKVGDSVFTFSGASVTSPIIDTRELESNVVIKSGDTLAIGGLLQDEVTKGTTKVPVLGDIPGLGYLFQEHVNARTKRNLLVFVTPTIIKQGYGTGLEDQVSGLHHSGEEFADPNGWRNNARGAYRVVPTSHREVAADYPKPGVPPEPLHPVVEYGPNAAGDSK